jgi:hypothetical protein
MAILRTLLKFLPFALASTAAFGAVTTSVVDLPVAGGAGVQRFLHVRPDAPVANIVVLSGGDGVLLIQDDGTMMTRVARCGPITRNRQAFAERGYALALVDAVSNVRASWEAVVQDVIAYMRQQGGAAPTWISGGSASTQLVLELAASLPATLPLGLLVGSPERVPAATAAAVRRPTLVIYNPRDASQYGPSLYNMLTAAPIRQQISLSGGSSSDCGFHLFQDQDAELVAATVGFMDQYNAALDPGPASTALAVEFYNAALDHYFLTHIPGEIAALDAGVTIRGWKRTGQSFNVYPSAVAGASPVCRFYIPPEKGDSHFYGRGTTECTATAAANPTFVNEDPQFFHVMLPTAGVCPVGTRNVHRVFSNRPDANHRYTVDPAIRDQMAGRGWLPEGDGPALVVMCAPQ